MHTASDEEYADGRADIEKNMNDVDKRITRFYDSMDKLLANDPSLKEDLWYYDDDADFTWYYDDIKALYEKEIPVWRESLAEGNVHNDEVFSLLPLAC